MRYNAYMKVWRGFTLTVWVILLMLLASFALQYRAIQTTVLDSGTAKAQLVKTGAYEQLRDTLLLEKLRTLVQERYPENTIVDSPMLRTILAETLPRDEMERRFEPAVDAFYRWIDSKEPEINFSIDLSDKTSLFYRALEVQLGKKLATLPSCGDYRYPPEEAVLVDKCIPVYVSVLEATSAAMSILRSDELPIGNTVTPETFALPTGQSSVLKQLPTYLNYLWVLNYVAIALFALIALLVIVSRRSLGILAVGVSIIGSALLLWLTQSIIRNLVPHQAEGVFAFLSELTKALLTAFTATSTQYALVCLLIGTLLAAGAVGWRWWRKGRHHG